MVKRKKCLEMIEETLEANECRKLSERKENLDQKVKVGRGNADFVVSIPIKESGNFRIF